MAYYFAVETEENNYVAINIKRCRLSFTTNYRYENPFECTLKEINNITTSFKNEEELKKSLANVYVLPEEYFDKPLALIYAEGIERRLVNGNVLYEESRNLLDSSLQVINFIKNKYDEKDCLFFRQLAETYPNDSIIKSRISVIASLIERQQVTEDTKLKEICSIGDELVEETTKLLIYENDMNNKGTISYTNKINYENLHNLVSFITDYEKSLNKDKKTQHKKVLTQENASK